MGNANQIQQNPNTQNFVTNNKKNSFKEPVDFDQNEVFNKIINISDELLSEYNSNFLNSDFCSKLAFIFEKKLSHFNIKLLKSIYNDINKKNIDRGIVMTTQYLPNNEEKFTDLSGFFGEILKENFWKNNISINPQSVNNNSNIKNIASSIKFQPRYIDIGHVNKLLKSINEKYNLVNNKSNSNNNNNNNNQHIGGVRNNKKDGARNNNNENGETNNEENNEENNENQTQEENNQPYQQEEPEEQEELEEEQQDQPGNNKPLSNNEIKRQQQLKERLRQQQQQQQQKQKQQYQQQNQQKQQYQQQKQQYQQQNQQKQQYQPQQYQQQNQQKQQYQQPSIEEINNRTNEAILRGVIPNQNKKTNEENTNKIIKLYTVPRSYEKPEVICKKDKCKLTKKQLCQAISENFIVRNNIIAAILTTIPYKNEKGQYEGGICYTKFQNLNNCEVCLPYDFNSLDYNNMTEVYRKIFDKADNLNDEECKKNQGFFLKLSDKQKTILATKAKTSTEEDIRYNKKLKNNRNFMILSEKLKQSYFEGLTSLIIILEEIQKNPIVNNKTLNFVSNKTKTIIDNMYNLCHYYYVFAIIALINSDIKEDKISSNRNNKLSNSINKAISTKSLGLNISNNNKKKIAQLNVKNNNSRTKVVQQ